MNRKPRFAIVHTLLSLMICLCLACATGQDTGAPCPTIEMSVVVDTMSRIPLVTTGDITSATASQADDQWVVNFTVTDSAAKRVHELTAQNIGRNVALVVGGKVHGTPRIAGAISGGYRIDGFNRADAERLATAINSGCRR
jgi:preprotein translocase subunit SecD